MLILGDNLTELKKLADASIDLIYIDPPFNKGKTFTAKNGSFEDKFKSRDDYIQFMRDRLLECHRILKATGSIYLHCDNTTNHINRMLLEDIFGESNYRNEIVWVRNNGRLQNNKYPPRCYGKAQDVILFFTKSNDYTFNPYDIVKPHSPTDLKRYNYTDERGAYGRFTTFRGIFLGKSKGLFYKFKGIIPPDDSGGWIGTKEWMEQLDKQGDLEFDDDGKLWLKRRVSSGILVGSVWNDIKKIKQDEYLNYPTQKPLALLERIIKASSNEGDIVLDAFCGSGTTCVAAKNLGRKYIGIDSNPQAIEITTERLDAPTLL